MPLARINIEQIESRRWTAEVEAGGQPGGPPFKRQSVSAYTLDDVFQHVTRIYLEQVPGGLTKARSLAQEGTMEDDKNPNERPSQEPVQRSPGDQRADVNAEDRSADQPKSLPDDIRPDQRIPGPGGINSADNKGAGAPIPPTESGNKLPGGRMQPEEIDEHVEEAEGEEAQQADKDDEEREKQADERHTAMPDKPVSQPTPPRSGQRTPEEEKKYQEKRQQELQQQQAQEQKVREDAQRRAMDDQKRMEEQKRAEERRMGQQAHPHHTAPRARPPMPEDKK